MELLRRTVARLVIGTFALAAALGIYALLSPGPFGELQGDILLTTVIVGVGSLAVLCYLASANSRWWPVGLLGVVLAIAPVTMSLAMVWAPWPSSDTWWDVYGITMTLALTMAQISLLAGLTSGARRRQDWLLAVTTVLALALAALVIALLLSDGSMGDDVMRLLGVLAILDALGSVSLVALRVFGGAGASPHRAGVPLTLDAERSARLREAAAQQGLSAEALLDRLLGSGGDDVRDRHPGIDG